MQARRWIRGLALILMVGGLGSCVGNSETGPTMPAKASWLYVANNNSSTITKYPADADGDTPPTATIGGRSTGLNHPWGVALDRAGKIYVANSSSNSITVYAAGATGNATPIATISGGLTRLSIPMGVAVDGAGNFYVADNNKDYIYFYLASLLCCFHARIEGPSTGLNGPMGVAVQP